MIPQSFIQDLLARVDIVELIDRYVPLKKGGANYLACCPFHNEKSPSFTVSPVKQFYHCFGCGAHGTAIGFLMEYSGVNFVDAVRELAGQVGLQVPDDPGAPSAAERARSRSLIELMALAAQHYRSELKRSERAKNYLRGRGLTGEIAARFGIGYAPEGWQSLTDAVERYDDDGLIEAGLVIRNDAGRRYDRFRDRIMFPILDTRGQVIAFGGRIIDAGEPKYLNSPETPLFEKGRELYGLFQARQAIRESGSAVVVEGYMDVVALAQFGVLNAVATLGTACTPVHVQKLLRQAERVVFCFDGDTAGRKAARRALDASLPELADDRSVAFLFLPPEHDPDSFVREHGAEAFRHETEQAMPLTEFLLAVLREDCDLDTAEGRARMVHNAREHVPRIAAPVLRLQMLHALAEASGLAQVELERSLGLKPAGRGKAAPARAPRAGVSPLEYKLLRLIAHHPELGRLLSAELLQLLAEGPERAALAALLDLHEEEGLPATLAALFEHFRASGHENLFARIVADPEGGEADAETARAVLDDLLRRLEQSGLEREIETLARTATERSLSSEELHRYSALLAQKQKLRSRQNPS